MSETLSERICKECGVEPLFLCKIHSETKCETVYPDFENNSNNKLKLLEILSKYSMTCVYLQDMLPIENAIKYCLNVLKDTAYTYSARNKLKQAIRNEQWEV